MRLIAFAVFAFIVVNIWGCDSAFNLTPELSDTNFTVDFSEHFAGVQDGKDTVYDTRWYTCNSADNFVYVIEGGATVPNLDGVTTATCTTDVFQHGGIKTDDRVVAPKP